MASMAELGWISC